LTVAAWPMSKPLRLSSEPGRSSGHGSAGSAADFVLARGTCSVKAQNAFDGLLLYTTPLVSPVSYEVVARAYIISC
jgi:hypothetical protein